MAYLGSFRSVHHAVLLVRAVLLVGVRLEWIDTAARGVRHPGVSDVLFELERAGEQVR